MIFKIGDVEYRTLKAYKTQKLQKAMDSIWVEVDSCDIIYDIVEAAFLEGKKSERERVRTLLGLD
jgi:hypothetical protein